MGRHVEFSKEEAAQLLEIAFVKHVLEYRPKSTTACLARLVAEMPMICGLLDNNREGFIKMAQENIRLHNEIAALKDENEALKRLLKVGK